MKKGDRVCIYMPMVPELPIAMLACARIGAIHSVVFGGFSAESLAGRIVDCKSDVLLSCSAVQRGNKALNLKAIVDEALLLCKQKENFTPGEHTKSCFVCFFPKLFRIHGLTKIWFVSGTCLIYDNSKAVPRSKVHWVAGRDLWWQVKF